MFNRDGYNIECENRQHCRGGGIALIYKSTHTVKTIKRGKAQSFEYLISAIPIKGIHTNSNNDL